MIFAKKILARKYKSLLLNELCANVQLFLNCVKDTNPFTYPLLPQEFWFMSVLVFHALPHFPTCTLTSVYTPYPRITLCRGQHVVKGNDETNPQVPVQVDYAGYPENSAINVDTEIISTFNV